MMNRETMLEALECCIRNDACDQCPLMMDICDFPLAPMVQLPVQLVVGLMEEIKTAGLSADREPQTAREQHPATRGR